MKLMSNISKQVIFRGHVQGVGFRYTARNIVRGYPVTGYVRNQDDGSVEAVLQGTESDVQACIDEIQEYFGGYIRSLNISPMVYNPNWTEFEITF